jgi:hypothetical protein
MTIIRIPMKSFCVALFVAAGSLLAAESSRELTFTHTAAGLPSLQLSNISPPAIPSYSGIGSTASVIGRATYFRAFPNAPTDLIGRTSSRQTIIQDFESSGRSRTEPFTPTEVRRKSAISYPMSATDLIGPSSDRDKLIEAFKTRARSDK